MGLLPLEIPAFQRSISIQNGSFQRNSIGSLMLSFAVFLGWLSSRLSSFPKWYDVGHTRLCCSKCCGKSSCDRHHHYLGDRNIYCWVFSLLSSSISWSTKDEKIMAHLPECSWFYVWSWKKCNGIQRHHKTRDMDKTQSLPLEKWYHTFWWLWRGSVG